MNSKLAFFIIDDLLPEGNSGCGGEGCGCAILMFTMAVIWGLLDSLYTSCSNAIQDNRERKEVEQQRQRLQDFNDSLSTAYFWDFAKQSIEAEGFTGLTLHDTYVTYTFETFLKIVLSSGKNEYIESPPHGYKLEGNFHIEGDTILFVYDMLMLYDYEKDKAHELLPRCSEMNVYIRNNGYLDRILWRCTPQTVFIDAPYDSILEARKTSHP